LQQLNDAIRPGEITELRERIAGSQEFIMTARLRLDSLRLIFTEPRG